MEVGAFSNRWVELAVRRLAKGRYVKLICLKSTADFYGWSEFFPTVIESRLADGDGETLVFNQMRRGVHRGRHALVRISRDANKQGHPAGVTNQFRVSQCAMQRDYAEIAQGVGVEFGWMEDKNNRRRSQEEWRLISKRLLA